MSLSSEGDLSASTLHPITLRENFADLTLEHDSIWDFSRVIILSMGKKGISPLLTIPPMLTAHGSKSQISGQTQYKI